MIKVAGSNVTATDKIVIDRNKLEERDSGFLTVLTSRAERYETYDPVEIEVGTQETFEYKEINPTNLLTQSFTSVDLSFGGNTIYAFRSLANPITVDDIYVSLSFNNNFIYDKAGIKSEIVFLDSGDNVVDTFELENIFINELYGSGRVEVPSGATKFNVFIVTLTENPQGLQFESLFLNDQFTVNEIEVFSIPRYEQMLVQADVVTKYRDDLYQHELTLIENVAKFDAYYPADRVFSATPPKTLEQILDVYKSELEGYHNLLIDYDRVNDWINTPIRQKEFSGVNFSVVLQDLFRSIDAIPRVEYDSTNDKWVITPDFYATRNTKIDFTPQSQIKQQNNQDYATRIKSQLKNALNNQTTWFPSETGYILPKSSTPQKVTSRLRYELDSGIVDIVKVEVVDVVIFTESNVDETFSSIDITNHVVPKEDYDGLITPVNQRERGIHKKNAVQYQIGDRFITNLFIPEGEEQFFGFAENTEIFKNAIVEAGFTNGTLTGATPTNFIVQTELEDIKLRVQYIRQRDLDFTHHRQYLKNMNESTQVHKQRDSFADIERYKFSLKAISNRMGNEVREESKTFGTSENTVQLGDFNSENFVAIRVKNTYYNDQVLCEYILAEGFGNIDADTSLWREPSAFEIQRKDITTNLIIEDFIEISETQRELDSRLTAKGRNTFLKTFDDTITGSGKIHAALLKTTVTNATEVNTNGVYLPAFTGGGGNTSTFHVKIDDPISAGRGFYDEYENGQYGDDFIYTIGKEDPLGQFGEVKDFKLFFIPDVGINDNGKYPIPDTTTSAAFGIEALTGNQITDTINKDKNAKFAVTFQQHFVTDDKDIIIGNALGKYNRLVTDEAQPQRSFRKSTRPYTLFDEKIRDYDTPMSATFTFNQTERRIDITANEEADHFALFVGNELFLAFNKHIEATDTQSYYVNFTSQAQRVVIDQLEAPALATFDVSSDGIDATLQNFNDQGIDITATLDAQSFTTEVETSGENDTAEFNFTGLDPNTTYNLVAQAQPLDGSPSLASPNITFPLTTNILPTDVPVSSESRIESYTHTTGTRYRVFFNVQNTNDFPVNVIGTVEGFEQDFNTAIAANSTAEVEIESYGDDQRFEAETTYSVQFKFETTSFTNNWESNFEPITLFSIGTLESPTFGVSTSTFNSVSFAWGNTNNVNAQAVVRLYAATFDNQSSANLVDTQTITINGNSSATATFSADSETTYSASAEFLASGFNQASGFTLSDNETTPPPPTARPNFTFIDRTESSFTVEFENIDSEAVTVYWSVTDSTPDTDDEQLSLGIGETKQDTIQFLDAGTVYTIYWRAKAGDRPYSSVGQSTQQTLLQLDAPNYGTFNATETSVKTFWGNPNDVSVQYEAKLLSQGTPIDSKTGFANASPNGDFDVEFTNLPPNSDYVVQVKFLEDDFKQESPSTNSPIVSTLTVQAETPSITNIDPSGQSVTFTLVNNDDDEATIQYGVTEPLTNSATVTTQSTTGLSGLDYNTTYTLKARAIVSGKADSELFTSAPFTTDPEPTPTEWVFRSATTQNETLDRGIVSSCPSSSDNLAYLTSQIDPSTKPFGYVVRVTSATQDGLNINPCTVHYYEAQ